MIYRRAVALVALLCAGVPGGRVAGAQAAVSPPAAAAAPAPAVLDLANLPRAGTLSRRLGTPVPPPALRSNADGWWRDAEPADAIAQLFLQSHNDLCARSGADACLVVRRGRIAAEWYRADLPDSLPAVPSTEAFAGLLAMMLVADGKLASLDVPVCHFVNAWCDGARTGVTVRHLLTMTSGLAPRRQAPAVGTAEDMNAFVTGLRPAVRPGTRWAYSNEAAQLLSPILDAAAGEPVQEYAQRRLFAPLGMRDTHFHVDARGHAATYANLRTTPRDLARLGVFVLQRGRWNGRQLVPGALIDSLVRPSQRLNPQYGMLWWRLHSKDSSVVYVTRGYLATNMYVFPYQDLVVVRMQTRPLSGPPTPYEAGALPVFSGMLHAFAPAHWH